MSVLDRLGAWPQHHKSQVAVIESILRRVDRLEQRIIDTLGEDSAEEKFAAENGESK